MGGYLAPHKGKLKMTVEKGSSSLPRVTVSDDGIPGVMDSERGLSNLCRKAGMKGGPTAQLCQRLRAVEPRTHRRGRGQPPDLHFRNGQLAALGDFCQKETAKRAESRMPAGRSGEIL